MLPKTIRSAKLIAAETYRLVAGQSGDYSAQGKCCVHGFGRVTQWDPSAAAVPQTEVRTSHHRDLRAVVLQVP